MHPWLSRRALHDLFLLPASKSVVRLTHFKQTGTEYLASVRTQIPSQVIPLLSDYETEASEGWAEEDELDVSASKRAFSVGSLHLTVPGSSSPPCKNHKPFSRV